MSFWRLFLPFAAGYFLSLTYRSINGVATPQLLRDVALTSADLGLLTAAYFLTFSLFQPVLGVLLDRFGPSRVNAGLLLIATTGAVLFATAESLPALISARALIGLGVSACLMATFTAFAHWLPAHRLPAANGMALAVGGLGAAFASRPAEILLAALGWRDVFLCLAVGTVGVSVALWLTVRDAPRSGAPTPLIRQFIQLRHIVWDRAFWAIGLVASINVGGFYAWQGVWATLWLRDLKAYDTAQAANMLLLVAVAMVLGPLASGQALTMVRRRASDEAALLLGVAAINLLVTFAFTVVPDMLPAAIWILFTFSALSSNIAFAMLGSRFPSALAGRVNTCLNCIMFALAGLYQWLIGVAVGWAGPSARYKEPWGYQLAWALLLAGEAVALIWLWRWWRSAAR
jgi:MFS family permease